MRTRTRRRSGFLKIATGNRWRNSLCQRVTKVVRVESDLVVTSGPILKHPTPTIQKDWLKPGAYGSAVDFDSYWTGESLAQMDRISTDDHAQFHYYRSVGYFQQTPDPYADLGELVAGLRPGRKDEKERILAINLGLAMDDMAVAPAIYQKAKEIGLGVELPL